MKYYYLLIIATVFLFSCAEKKKPESATEIPNVEVTVVEEQSMNIPIQAVGSLSSKTQSNLSFMNGGLISKIYVDESERVEKGQLLASLDLTEISSRVEQARLGLEKARRDFRRAESLYQDSVATLEQYQDARTALELAQSGYRIASFGRKHSEIRAPSEGKILKVLHEENEMVAPGYPVLVFASTEAEWILRLSLTDKDVVQLNTDDSASIKFDAYPGRTFSSKVYEIGNAANLKTGTFEVELKLDSVPERLVTGLIGKARIFPDKRPVLIISPDALLEGSDLEGRVFRMNNGISEIVNVRIDRIWDNGIWIHSGVHAGDTLITSGKENVIAGEIVKIVKIESQ